MGVGGTGDSLREGGGAVQYPVFFAISSILPTDRIDCRNRVSCSSGKDTSNKSSVRTETLDKDRCDPEESFDSEQVDVCVVDCEPCCDDASFDVDEVCDGSEDCDDDEVCDGGESCWAEMSCDCGGPCDD